MRWTAMGAALVIFMTVVASGAIGVLVWGLVLEARSNRDRRLPSSI